MDGAQTDTADMRTPKTDPDFDPERSADREAVAIAMVTDLTKATPGSLRSALIQPQYKVVDTPQDPPHTPLRKKQRKRPREDEKICRVCGDKALAHNFDAITCESCKAFFRRNALRPERMTCLFKGECPVSVQTRRFCPACRLHKCFSVGMKADLILDDVERRARMEKVSENRARRKVMEPDNSVDTQMGSLGQVVTLVENQTSKQPASVGGDNYSTSVQQMKEGSGEASRTTLHYVLTSVSPLTSPQPQPSVGNPVAGHTTVSPVHTVHQGFQPDTSSCPQPASSSTSTSITQSQLTSSKASEPDFQHVPRDILPSDPHMYWRLSEEEKTLLTQLSSAYQDTLLTLPERVPCEDDRMNGGDPPSLESVFETSENNTKLLISFVQRLGDFHLLREDDKIAVLQASGMRSEILRWTALYVVERNAWLTRFGECGVAKASAIFGHEDVIQEMAAFCRSTKVIVKNDVTLFVLMHCLILFDPREPNLVDRQLIGTFRDKYIILLKHYLESEYSFLYTERYLRAILDKTMDIRQVAEKSLGIMREFREYVPPLMKQVFNLQESS